MLIVCMYRLLILIRETYYIVRNEQSKHNCVRDSEITEIFSYENHSLKRDLNPGAPEYKAIHYITTFVT